MDEVPVAPLPDAPQSQLHLDALDGIRALAALFVVLHHAWTFSITDFPIRAQDGLYGLVTNWLLYGHLSVDVFIVLSGFCLALPLANDNGLRGGVAHWYARRARRILPPYYIALALFVLLRVAIDALAHHPLFSLTDLLVHTLLLQDIVRESLFAFDPPTWSVAVECKIYLFFPLLALLLLRGGKYGRVGVLVLTALVGYGLVDVWQILNPKIAVSDMAHTCPWYLFLFGMGVVAASVANDRAFAYRLRVWGWAGAGLLMAAFVALLPLFPMRTGEPDLSRAFPVMDAVAGALTALWLIRIALGKVLWETRLLCNRWLVRIGTFAYSLYLIHYPILEILWKALVKPAFGDQTQGMRFLILAGLGLPLSVALAYGFFRFAERPFLRRRTSAPAADLAAP